MGTCYPRKHLISGLVIAIIVAFVVVIHVQCLVSVYLSLVKIKYSVCVCEKKKKMWYTHTHTHNGILLSHKEEWNIAICNNMDGPREYHTKSDRERQTLYITYMWNLKKRYKWTYLQNRNRLADIENNYGYQRGKVGGRDKLGVWD